MFAKFIAKLLQKIMTSNYVAEMGYRYKYGNIYGDISKTGVELMALTSGAN